MAKNTYFIKVETYSIYYLEVIASDDEKAREIAHKLIIAKKLQPEESGIARTTIEEVRKTD